MFSVWRYFDDFTASKWACMSISIPLLCHVTARDLPSSYWLRLKIHSQILTQSVKLMNISNCFHNNCLVSLYLGITCTMRIALIHRNYCWAYHKIYRISNLLESISVFFHSLSKHSLHFPNEGFNTRRFGISNWPHWL